MAGILGRIVQCCDQINAKFGSLFDGDASVGPALPPIEANVTKQFSVFIVI